MVGISDIYTAANAVSQVPEHGQTLSSALLGLYDASESLPNDDGAADRAFESAVDIANEFRQLPDIYRTLDIGPRLVNSFVQSLQAVSGVVGNPTYIAQMRGVCDTMIALRGMEAEQGTGHNVSSAFLALFEYAGKAGLSKQKREAAYQMCIQLSENLNPFLQSPSAQTAGVAKQAIQRTVNNQQFNCLKTSRTFKQKLGNFLWCTVGFLAAMVKKVATGSWCFRSNGGSKRHAVQSALCGKSGLSWFNAMKTSASGQAESTTQPTVG